MPNKRQKSPRQAAASEMPKLMRDALAHLYDAAHLQNHALGRMLVLETSGGAVSRGQALRRLLLDTLETMRPGDLVPYGDKAWRPYRVLLHRYAQRMSVLETQSELGISERQLQREHSHALRIMCSLLEPHLEQSRAKPVSAASRRGPYDIAVEQFLAGSKPEQLALDELAQSVIDDLKGVARERGVTPELNVAQPLEPIYGDRGVVRQILMSAISHALSIADVRTLSILLATDARHATVTANVTGDIPAELGLDSSSAERLALADRLARAIGGELALSRTKAVITLPLSRKIILVVDDNQDIVDLIQRFLSDGRYKVFGALSGDEAITLAQQIGPDLILLDVMMPSRDGWEVLQLVKHSPATAHIPVAICSILSEQALAESLGADDYLPKPVTQLALLALLERVEHRIG